MTKKNLKKVKAFNSHNMVEMLLQNICVLEQDSAMTMDPSSLSVYLDPQHCNMGHTIPVVNYFMNLT
jgi:hypothetical protein